jgi:predicted O-methyltransferase YrrM
LGKFIKSNIIPDSPGLVIEIGCWEGKSAMAIANSVYPTNLVCNDTWLGNIEESKLSNQLHPTEVILQQRDVYSIFVKNMDNFTKGNYSVVKQDCLQWLRSLKDSVKFCHIDASHDYYSVYNTILLLLPLMTYGGILCGDDFVNAGIHHPTLNGGVERAVRELLPGFQNRENFWYWVKK